MKKILVIVFLVFTTTSCSGTSNSVSGGNSGKLSGPQNPGVMVDDDNHCTITRSAMMDDPGQTIWSTGCR